jgi:hypothetical protein
MQLYLSCMCNFKLVKSYYQCYRVWYMWLYGHGEMLTFTSLTQHTSLWKGHIKTLMTYSAITWRLFEELFIQETEHGSAPTCLSTSAKKQRIQPAAVDTRTNHPWLQQTWSHLQLNPQEGNETTYIWLAGLISLVSIPFNPVYLRVGLAAKGQMLTLLKSNSYFMYIKI